MSDAAQIYLSKFRGIKHKKISYSWDGGGGDKKLTINLFILSSCRLKINKELF